MLVGKGEVLASLLTQLGMQGFTKSDSSDDYDTEIALATIRPLAEEVITIFNLKDRKGNTIQPEKLVKGSILKYFFPQPFLKVEQYEDSDILEVKAFSPKPDEASNIANAFSDRFVRDAAKRLQEDFQKARAFITARLESSKQDYISALSAIADYKLETGIVDVDAETEKLMNKLESLKNSYEDNESNIIAFEEEIAQAKRIIKDRPAFRKETQDYIQSEQYKTLKSRINDLLVSISVKELQLHKTHPDFQEIIKELETVKNLAEREAKQVLNSERFAIDPIYDDLRNKLVSDVIKKEIAMAKRKFFEKYVDFYQKKLLNIPAVSMENSKLTMTLTVNRDIYQRMLQYLTQVNVAEFVALSKINVVEHASVPLAPFFPIKNVNYVLGFFLGAFWAIAAGLFVEYIDNTVKTPEDIETLIPVKLFGMIPYSKDLKGYRLISDLHSSGSIANNFRMIKNQIALLSRDKLPKAIMFLSGRKNEGKTALAANLGLAFQMAGNKVILLDMNPEDSMLSGIFGCDNSKGAADYIAGEASLDSIITSTQVNDLDIIPWGAPQPGFFHHSAGEKIRVAISHLKRSYDHIFIDTASLLNNLDAMAFGKHADGVLLVVESQRTPIKTVKNTITTMKNAELPLLGVILNKFRVYSSTYYRLT